MQRIIMLGTGNGFVYEYYETCFLIENNSEYFLIDTGGSNDIVNILSKLEINLDKINNIFISHTHTDHLLGLFWLLKKMSIMHMHQKYNNKLNIYCNDEVADAIKNTYKYFYPHKLIEQINEILNIVCVKDKETKNICGMDYTFYDMHAKGNKLYGFETLFENNKSLVFLGDETCKPEIYNLIRNKDYVMHEAFCLDSEADIFHPYEKNHSTVKSVCQNFKDLNIKNLILYHTVENHKKDRKELYMDEAKKYYDHNVIIPNDLEILEIN